MKQSLLNRLQSLSERHQEVALLLAQADTMNQPERFRDLSREYSELDPVIQCFQRWQALRSRLADALELTRDPDPEMSAMAREDADQAEVEAAAVEQELHVLMLPSDPHDGSNVFLEIRAGTGGDEAALFAGDLLRMYLRFADNRRWQVEILSQNEGEHGGYKEVICRVSGQSVYATLKFESGAHRVQRVPETESQGRIHTSACTVAIMPEPDATETIEINKSDLREDTFRASGAGGQHVNKTDSAIRLTHLPTGIVVECQDERSQHKNRARALSLLQAKLQSQAEDKAASEQAAARKKLVGSGDRSERIRTYNFPQGRITDHRINLTLYKLEECLAGDLEPVVGPLLQEYQAELLASLSEGEA